MLIELRIIIGFSKNDEHNKKFIYSDAYMMDEVGIAVKNIRNGKKLLDSQLAISYDSSSGFRDAFFKIMGNVPSKSKEISTILKSIIIDTQLGSMLAIASDTHLYLLEFADRRGLENEIIKS